MNEPTLYDVAAWHAKYDLASKREGWLLTNDSGDKVASGIYLYLIKAGDDKTKGKVVVIK